MGHSEEFRSMSSSPGKPSPATTLFSSIIATILTNSTLIRFQEKIKNEIIYGGGRLPELLRGSAWCSEGAGTCCPSGRLGIGWQVAERGQGPRHPDSGQTLGSPTAANTPLLFSAPLGSVTVRRGPLSFTTNSLLSLF